MTNFKEHWLQKFWRPLTAITYIIIVLFDFVIMPSIHEFVYVRHPLSEIINDALQFTDKGAALTILTMHQEWQPLTLMGNGMFHLAMLAILGTASFTRGQEKIARTKALLDNTSSSNNINISTK